MTQKVAYVTGGMGGIGTAICQRLHKDGYKVIAGCGPTRDFAKWLAEQAALGYTFYASAGNVGDWQSTVDAFSKAKAEHGPIDILVNNAGIADTRAALEITEADWRRVLDTNLDGAWRMAQAVAKSMIADGRPGCIVNIASILGLRQATHLLAYAAAKAALVQVTKSLALEWARHGIRVNAIAPGYILTEMNRDFFESEAGQAVMKRVPQRRIGSPRDLDGALLLLVSDAGAFMTGAVVVVDGGHVVNSL
jgi:acetoacetyl-CoA reductase